MNYFLIKFATSSSLLTRLIATLLQSSLLGRLRQKNCDATATIYCRQFTFTQPNFIVSVNFRRNTVFIILLSKLTLSYKIPLMMKPQPTLRQIRKPPVSLSSSDRFAQRIIFNLIQMEVRHVMRSPSALGDLVFILLGTGFLSFHRFFYVSLFSYSPLLLTKTGYKKMSALDLSY